MYMYVLNRVHKPHFVHAHTNLVIVPHSDSCPVARVPIQFSCNRVSAHFLALNWAALTGHHKSCLGASEEHNWIVSLSFPDQVLCHKCIFTAQ